MARLTSAMLVGAVLAAVNREMVRGVVSKRGDATRGAILVRLENADGAVRVEARRYDPEAGYVWGALHDESWIAGADADAILEKEFRYDPDCWGVAIETSDGANPFASFTD